MNTSKDTAGVNCPYCGAAASADAATCDLCGSALAAQETLAASTPASAPEQGPFCHMCGRQSPVGARFCSACGTALHTAPAPTGTKRKRQSVSAPAASPARTRPAFRPPGRQVAVLMVAAAMVVVALFLITRLSRTRFPAEAEATSEVRSSANGTDAVAAPLSGEVADEAARLEDELAGLDGDALRAKQEELLAVLASAGRADRVAELREQMARTSPTAETWKAAGDALYAWMESSEGEQRMAVAQRTADAYGQTLALGPDDLVVRTAMAMAFLNTRAPMQGVMQIRQVLETDPDHLEGNFYYGVMLMQINRFDQALAQFEKVKTLVASDHPLYRQADMMLANIRALGGNANS